MIWFYLGIGTIIAMFVALHIEDRIVDSPVGDD